MLNRVREPSGAILEMTATVENLLPNAELRQSRGILGILTFDHRWLLEPAGGGTKVIQHEVDRGIGLWLWSSDWIEPAYAATQLGRGTRNALTFDLDQSPGAGQAHRADPAASPAEKWRPR